MTENEGILFAFFERAREANVHWAEVRIEEIEQPSPHKRLTDDEVQTLRKLLETETGRQALKKLLVQCGSSNFFSVLTNIDGYTFDKSVELVNAETLEPLTDRAISPVYSIYSQLLRATEDVFNYNE